MTSKEIRQQFLDFFASKEHTIVPSSPVVPLDDPTLMFTNAGMNQFKDVFLATGSRSYTRAADTQKCIRAGGKHNDLDDVGQDTYHHTFFEMLGNWSFGDYFKEEAIEWAWELLTGVWGIDKDRLHATYFGGLRKRGDSDEATRRRSDEGDARTSAGAEAQTSDEAKAQTSDGSKAGLTDDRRNRPSKPEPQASACANAPDSGGHPDGAWELEPDYEARDLWLSKTDIDPSHVHPGSMKDNFWEMGETGPCGPCSEIHIDLTPDKSGAALVNAGDARVIELWNLVFIQFNRANDGKLSLLPAKHVDTGMGFERLCAVLQGMARNRLGQTSNYDTDVFSRVFDAIREVTGAPAYAGTLPQSDEATVRRSDGGNDRGPGDDSTTSRPAPPLTNGKVSHAQVMVDVSYRVIADHLRCLTFAITDGAMPSNEGRGYVLRRILRRAVRYGRQYMNMHEPFLCRLVKPLGDLMGDAFPELPSAHGGKNIAHVEEILRDEEESFLKTLDRGIRLFKEAANHARRHHHGKISGEDAFKLHDTYGFPIDLTELMAEENGLSIDIGEYERLMEEAKEKARAVMTYQREAAIAHNVTNEATDDSPKYGALELQTELIDFWSRASVTTEFDRTMVRAAAGQLVLTRTCFYSEQGGQISDTGFIQGNGWRFEVTNVRKIGDTVHHMGTLIDGEIVLPVDGRIQATAIVGAGRRSQITNNHTSTHIMNWALREVLCPAEERERPHVQQKGSLVDPEKTRFDFSHNKPLTDEEIARIEELCNEQITASMPVFTDEVDQAKAREINTLRAVFGEKYPDVVRVVSIGAPITEAQATESGQREWLLKSPKNPEWMKYSVEFCGGTHLKRSSEAERFVLTTEEGVAKGIRRVVGISGDTAKAAEALGEQLLTEARALAGKPPVAPQPSRDRKGAEGTPDPHHDGETADGPSDANRPPTEPQASACANVPDSGTVQNTGRSRGLKPAAREADLATRLTALQQRLADAVIPLRVRREIQAILGEVQKTAKEQQKQAAADAGGAVKHKVASLLSEAEQVAGVTIVVGEVPPAGADALRDAIDWVRNKTEASAVLLANRDGEKVILIAGMSKSVVKKGVKAGDLIKEIAPLVGGRGGGRPDMAQGGGNDPGGIPKAIDHAAAWIRENLA